MEKRIAEILNWANMQFYRDFAGEFSGTREGPWNGWTNLAPELERLWEQKGAPLRILDLGCGNMRFERYLVRDVPQVRFEALCVDSCKELARPMECVRFVYSDLVQCMLEARPMLPEGEPGGFDAVCAFGLFHHIPGSVQRTRLLRSMLDATAEGGLTAVSFWQPLDDPRLASKSAAVRSRALDALSIDSADLDEGDCFLGWADSPHALRYIHHFTEGEVDNLLEACAPGVPAVRYSADRCNAYAILKP